MFLRLAMDIRDDQHLPPSSNTVPVQNKTTDPVELPRGTSDGAVEYRLSCMGIRWLARMARGCPLMALITL